MLMDPSTYSFQDDIFTAQVLPVWSLSPDVNFDLTALEFLSEPLTPPPVLPRSAFQKYVRPNRCFQPASSAAPMAGNKLHKRLIAMLRNMKTPPETRESSGAAPESSRGFRHMIRERQRREKLSQSYADLYAILCSRSKGDKNSIVQSAAMYVRELKGVKDELHKKNEELKAKILGIDAFSTEGIKVKFEVANPNSGLDSMIAALRRLQSMDVKAKAIRSDLSTGGLATTMTIQTKMAACEVEKEIEEALRDVERESYGYGSYDPLVVFPGNNHNNITTCMRLS